MILTSISYFDKIPLKGDDRENEAEADQYAAAMIDTEFTELMQYAV